MTNTTSTQNVRIGNDLIEAYKGYYEDELEQQFRATYDEHVKSEIAEGAIAVESWDGWIVKFVKLKIQAHTPKERLEIYCNWNGILGYSTRLYEIATGEL